jgi:N-acetyltransferase
MEWGREEERESGKKGVVEVVGGVRLKDGRKGRIVCFRADVGGRIGSKVCLPLFYFFRHRDILTKSRS